MNIHIIFGLFVLHCYDYRHFRSINEHVHSHCHQHLYLDRSGSLIMTSLTMVVLAFLRDNQIIPTMEIADKTAKDRTAGRVTPETENEVVFLHQNAIIDRCY